MIAYPDTGFLVSLYGEDNHSPAATELVKSSPVLILTSLGEAEFVNALELKVFRKDWTHQEARDVYDEFLANQAAAAIRSVSFPLEAWARAVILSRRHGAAFGTRTLDVLHVAAALILKPDLFFTFDKRQSQLAKAEGLRVLPA